MLKKKGLGKKTRRIRKPDIPVLALASLTVILLLAWGGLYWQEHSVDAAAAQGNDDIELPVIMLDLDTAAKERQPQESDPGKGNGPEAEPVGGAGGQDPGKLLEDLAQSPGGLLGMEDGWPNLPSPPQGTDGAGQEASVPTPGTTHGDPTPKPASTATPKPTPTPTPASTPSSEPTQVPVVTSKPSPTPAASEQPSATPSPTPSAEPTPDESDNDLVQQYELELLGLQAGCITDVKSVLKEMETQVGNVDPSDIEALQRIGAEAAASLEATGAACETQFNEVAARAGQDGVSAVQIGEWRQTYNEVMEQLRAEAELKLQQQLGI